MLLASFAALGPAAAAAAQDAPGSGSLTVTDDEGRTIRLDESPCRIVSLVPAATEIIFALGARECLAGRSRWDDYPPGVEDIPDVGQAIDASAERVLAVRPDLLILVAGSDNARTVEEFDRLGVPALVLRMNRLEELEGAIRRFGEILGRRRAADSLWSSIQAELDSVEQAVGGRDRPVVYYDIAFPPAITVGRGSYLDTLIVIAGARNAFADVEAPSPRISFESIAVRDPDVIVFPTSRAWGGATSPDERPLWGRLRAVREGRIARVDADLLHRLGPRVGRAAAHLAEAIRRASGDGQERP